MDPLSKYIADVHAGKVDVVSVTKKALEECRTLSKEYHYCTSIAEERALSQAKLVAKSSKGKLAGVLFSVKDALCVKGVESAAGSSILEGYIPVFDAAVVESIEAEGGIVIAKTAQDEFGFGTFNLNVGPGKKVPLHPLDKKRACGGSSGGCAGLTRIAPFPHIGIGESTGGSIEAPASFCGVYALCPTYGRISRYGLIPYASSLDKIGPMATSLFGVALAAQILCRHDPRDSTSLFVPEEEFTAYLGKSVKGKLIGVVRETIQSLDKGIKAKFDASVAFLKKKGAIVKEISLPLVAEHGLSVYYILAMSEASTNLACLSGLRYGRQESMKENYDGYASGIRSRYFSLEAKRRIMLGTFARMSGFRDAYYLQAARARTLMIEEYKKAFKDFDVLLSPTMPIVAPTFEEIRTLSPLEHYQMDIMTVGPNLCGLPHLMIPNGEHKGLPTGIMMIANHCKESELFVVGGGLV